jgi:NAD(P)-dependent dehydrogenase (short-subunit alcohol dehydrogenase family)
MKDGVALVTGAGGALGGEVARALSKRGHAVMLVDADRQKERLAELASSLDRAAWVAAELTDEAAWQRVTAGCHRDLGASPALAALVAGGWRGGTPLHDERDDATWRAMLGSNLETVYRGLRALLPAMVAAKQGSVVVVGSRVAEQPWTSGGAAAYAAAKSAVVALARAVAAEVRDHGVRVNAVLPSTLDSKANRAAMPNADPSRWVSLESAAGVIAFLLSDEARDVSGAAIPVYGRA